MPIALAFGVLFVGSQMFLLAHGGKMLLGGVLYALKQRRKGYKPDENVFTDRYVEGGMLISKDSTDPIGNTLGMLSDDEHELKRFLSRRFDLTKSEAKQLATQLAPALTTYKQLKKAQTLKDLEEEQKTAAHFREEMEPVILYLDDFPKDRVR